MWAVQLTREAGFPSSPYPLKECQDKLGCSGPRKCLMSSFGRTNKCLWRTAARHRWSPPSMSVSAGLSASWKHSTVAKEIPPLSLYWAASLSGYLGFSSPFPLRSPLGPGDVSPDPVTGCHLEKGSLQHPVPNSRSRAPQGTFFQNLTMVPSNVFELWLLEASNSMLV